MINHEVFHVLELQNLVMTLFIKHYPKIFEVIEKTLINITFTPQEILFTLLMTCTHLIVMYFQEQNHSLLLNFYNLEFQSFTKVKKFQWIIILFTMKMLIKPF